MIFSRFLIIIIEFVKLLSNWSVKYTSVGSNTTILKKLIEVINLYFKMKSFLSYSL